MKIKYQKENDNFLIKLNYNVDFYFKQKSKSRFGNKEIIKRYMIIKTLIIICYSTIYHYPNVCLSVVAFSLLGPLFIILALNVSHDAVHGVAHSNKRINTYLKFQMDLFGANSFAWKRRHKIGHHSFPNILNKDPDLKQSSIVKILPGAKHLKLHKYQHIYVPLLYSCYTFNWVFIRDFKDFFHNSTIGKIPKVEYYRFIIFKILYLFIFIIMPIHYSNLNTSLVITANICMHILASYFLTIALIPSHVSEKSIFPLPNKDGLMPYSWSHHQVITTTDFATKNKFTTWILGGFNHHIAHHLYPSISHVHYPKITPIVKQTIIEFNLPYSHINSLLKAYLSHYNLLKKNGKR